MLCITQYEAVVLKCVLCTILLGLASRQENIDLVCVISVNKGRRGKVQGLGSGIARTLCNLGRNGFLETTGAFAQQWVFGNLSTGRDARKKCFHTLLEVRM